MRREQEERKRRGISSAARALRNEAAKNGSHITQTQAEQRVRGAVKHCDHNRKE